MRLAWLAITVCVGAHAQSNPMAREQMLSGGDCPGAGNIIAEDAREPSNALFMRVQHIGDPGTEELREEVAHEVTWHVGALTGLPAPASAQRGYRDTPPPAAASAFQLDCNAAGFLINSFQFSHAQALFGEGPSVSIARSLDPAPPAFENPKDAFALQASIAVPTSYSPHLTEALGVTAVSFFYYARDTTTGTYVAHVIGLHDNRPRGFGGAGEETVLHDGVTAFAGSPLAEFDGYGNAVRFVDVPARSARARYGETWNEPAFYRAEIPYARFKAMLEALKASALPGTRISTEPLDYRIVFFGVLGEVFVGTTHEHDVMLGGSVRDLVLLRARRAPLVGRSR